MSYNIRHGEGMDEKLDLSRIANIIKRQKPDLCGLQEIDQFCKRSNSIDQSQFLARSTGMQGSFGKFMEYQEGAYGMATLSGLPLISTKVLSLPDAKNEPRSSIIHEVEIVEDCAIVFANVHLDWIKGEEGVTNRMNQAKALINDINKLNKASIIIGDFNCTPASPTMNYFKKQGFIFVEKGADNLSFQGENRSEIDHVLYRNSDEISFQIKTIQLLKEKLASDHRPLIADLEVTFYQ